MSSDAFATYDDGSGSWCFSCNDPEKFKGAGPVAQKSESSTAAKGFSPIDTTLSAITARGITEDTCRKCDYRLGKLWDGTPVHVQLIKDDSGKLIDQKTRTRDKQFKWLGQSAYKNNGGIIGEWSWPAKGKTVVITEGEIDRMSVSQAFDNKYATGSLPNGSGSVKKALLASWEKLLRFDHIVLCFDNDEPGQKALAEACELLPVGRVKIMSVPGKDANATLMEDGPAPIIRAYWDAKPFRPDGIVEGSEFSRERLKSAMGKRKGLELPYPKLNAMWMGLRPAEITMLVAGSGIGKSTLARAIAYHMRVAHGSKIGNIYLEEDNDTSVAAYCALHAGVPLKSLIADPASISDAQWDAALAAVVHEQMMFYDHFGSLQSDRLLTMMRYMAASGCQFIVLDHISIVVSGLETMDERKDIDVLMTKLASFVKETGVGIIAIVHLKRSSGKDFNGGDQISLNDLRGSASLEQLSFNVLALERNQQDEDDKLYAQIRSLKCRITGETGEADLIKWNIAKGCYEVATRSKEIPDFDPHEKSEEKDIVF